MDERPPQEREPVLDRPVTSVLARFAADLTIEAMPSSARERTKDLLLDALGAALAGLGEPDTGRVRRLTETLFGPGTSTVIGGGSGCLAGATVVNAHLVSSVSLCDVHYPTWCHLTPEVVPPALAVGESRASSGERLLLAIAAGCELTARIGLGLNYRAFHDRGWNTSGVTGVFGSAAAAGLLLGLDAVALAHALGIAGAQAAGSDAQRGTPTVRFHQPRAALSGLVGAQLAAEGFTAMPDVLADPAGGVYVTHSDGGRPERAVRSLGSVWELEDVWLTRLPMALLMRNVVDVLLELTREARLDQAEIEQVTIALSPRAYELYGEMDFTSTARARTCPRFVAAVVTRDRRCGLDQFVADELADPVLRSFADERVRIVADAGLAERAVRVELVDRRGTRRTHARAVAHGDAADPLTHGEVVDKFRTAASGALSDQAQLGVVGFVEDLENQADVGRLLALLRGAR